MFITQLFLYYKIDFQKLFKEKEREREFYFSDLILS